METQSFEKLLLKSAFSCMVCDGNIDKNELEIIKSIFSTFSFHSIADVNEIIDQFIKDINSQGDDFLRLFLKELKVSELTEDEELKIIDFPLRTIYSDFNVDYNEIRFFKIIRSKLKVTNDRILEKFPSKDVFLDKTFDLIREKVPSIEQLLEEDIMSESPIESLNEEFFTNSKLPHFEFIRSFDNGFLNSIKE